MVPYYLSLICLLCSGNLGVVSTNMEFFIVETIPKELKYNETITSKSTYESWLEMINSANHSIDIASMYWTLMGNDVMPNPVPESKKGADILEALINAKKNRSVRMRIAVDSKVKIKNDLRMLGEYAEIRLVNFTRLIGSGILHTKFIIIDGEDFYLGSANMDWRALTFVKELGIVMKNNIQLAEDLLKIFEIYWFLGNSNSVIPKKWSLFYENKFNIHNPLKVYRNLNDQYDVFLTSSPKQLCSSNRTNDLDAILSIIKEADQFIYIAVMDYFPLFLYEKAPKYWPVIDDALRKAVVEKNVKIRLLASHWDHSKPSLELFLKSLSSLNNEKILKGSIDTKLFQFQKKYPTNVKDIPYSKVNHNKYMVTDKTVYIGTSNWSADYFVYTGGVGIILNVTNPNFNVTYNIIKNIFLRDWNSIYAKKV